VLQLTGFSDPVYAEAYVTVHQYDIVMDVTVLNRCGAGDAWGCVCELAGHWERTHLELQLVACG
jgi:hypothetical protein